MNVLTLTNEQTPLIMAIKSMDENREPRIIHKLLLYGADQTIKVSFSFCI